MSDTYCDKHQVKKQVYGGCSAHPDNWYCEECDIENDLQDSVSDDKKLHYFYFSYIDKTLSGGQAYASTYTGYNDKTITRPMIDINKKNAGVNDSAVLLAVSYLGYMTSSEITGGTMSDTTDINKKHGDWFCTKCVGTVDSQYHNNCTYSACWIDSPLKKEISELKEQLKTKDARISELEKEAIEWKKVTGQMESTINELEADDDWSKNKMAELKHDNSNILMINATSIVEIKKLKDEIRKFIYCEDNPNEALADKHLGGLGYE